MATLTLLVDGKPALKGFGEFQQGADKAVTAGKKVTDQTDAASRSMKRSGEAAGGFRNAMLALGAGISAAFVLRDLIRVQRDFELTMATVKGVTGATADQFARLSEQARILGATTKFTAAQAGEGQLLLARAGLAVNTILGATPGVLDLAIASNIGLAQSADIVAQSLAQFRLQASETIRITDTFTTTANRTNTNVLELAEGMKYAGVIAGILGLAIEDTAAALGVMSDAGIKGSMAGTAFRQTMASLLDPTDKAVAALAKMGLTIDQVNPQKVGLITALERLKAAQLDGSNVFQIFETRAASGALVMVQYLEKLKAVSEESRVNAGVTEQIANIMENTLSGAFFSLRSAIEEVFLAAGDKGLGGALRALVDDMTTALRLLTGMAQPTDQVTTSVRVLTAAVVALGAAAATTTAIKVGGWLVSLGAAVAGLSFGPFVIAAAAATAGIAAYTLATQEAANATAGLSAEAKKAAEELGGIDAAVRDMSKIKVDLGTAQARENIAGQIEAIKKIRSLLVDQIRELRFGDVERGARLPADMLLRFVPEDLLARIRARNAAASEGQGAIRPEDFESVSRETALQALTEEATRLNEIIKALERRSDAASTGYSEEALAARGRTDLLLAELKHGQELLAMTEDQRNAEDDLAKAREATQGLAKDERKEAIEAIVRELALVREATAAEEIRRAAAEQRKAAQVEAEQAAQVAVRKTIAFFRSLIGVQKNLREETQKYLEVQQRIEDLKFIADRGDQTNEQLQRELELRRQMTDATEEQKEQIAALLDEIEGDNRLRQLADDIGRAFGQAFEDAVFAADKFRNVLKALAEDIERLIFRALVAEPFAKLISAGVQAGGNAIGLNSLLGSLSAQGNVFGGGRVIPFAAGAVFAGPHVFPMANGAFGLMGEREPEAIMPLRRTAQGRLGVEVVGGGGGGGSKVVNQRITIVTRDAQSFRRSQRQIAADLRRMAESA